MSNILEHPSVKFKDGSIYVTKPDGVIELRSHDCACPPGTVGGMRLNSFAVWARVDGKEWIRASTRMEHKVIQWAVAADNIEMFFALIDEI